MQATVTAILNRWPAFGLAVGVPPRASYTEGGEVSALSPSG